MILVAASEIEVTPVGIGGAPSAAITLPTLDKELDADRLAGTDDGSPPAGAVEDEVFASAAT